MRYFTWQLSWPGDGYGYGPEPVVTDRGGHLEASNWVHGAVESGTILGYLVEETDVSGLDGFDFAELTEADALTFAQVVNGDAVVSADGRIRVES